MLIYEQAGTNSTEVKASLNPMASCKISELIAHLETLKATHGDLPVVFWDQDTACKFDKLEDVICTTTYGGGDAALLVGGFHQNADSCADFNRTDIHVKDHTHV